VTWLVGVGAGCVGGCRVDDCLQSGQQNGLMKMMSDVVVACQLQTTVQTETETHHQQQLFKF